ncbi:hypothetical protein I317_00432 [Kwoniella heveanensis CBS 569]|nr:hypothetical protein I317_00432 [Kwoniella heveanensis CBS 569]
MPTSSGKSSRHSRSASTSKQKNNSSSKVKKGKLVPKRAPTLLDNYFIRKPLADVPLTHEVEKDKVQSRKRGPSEEIQLVKSKVARTEEDQLQVRVDDTLSGLDIPDIEMVDQDESIGEPSKLQDESPMTEEGRIGEVGSKVTQPTVVLPAEVEREMSSDRTRYQVSFARWQRHQSMNYDVGGSCAGYDDDAARFRNDLNCTARKITVQHRFKDQASARP